MKKLNIDEPLKQEQ